MFGIGMNNFGTITAEQLRDWDTKEGRAHDPKRYFLMPHAHGLYANTLAERGAVGSAVLFIVLIAWMTFLIRHRPQREDSDEEWLLWGSALAAWFITTVAGVFNTTLHHEHGMLATLLLGLWLSDLKCRPQMNSK